MGSYDIRNLVGNRFRLQKDVRAFEGSPNSPASVMWPEGRLTPTIDSWYEEDGQIWYMFGEVPPVQFIKHDDDALKPVAEYGAAEHLQTVSEENQDPDAAYILDFGFSTDALKWLNFENLSMIGKAVLLILGFFFLWKVIDLLK